MRAPRRSRLFVAVVAALLAGAGLVTLAPTSYAQSGAVVRQGWPVLTDPTSQAVQMNPPIEGSNGVSGWFKHSSPTVGNIDGDPALETVIGSLDGKVYAFNPDGSRVSGWPKRLDAPSTPTGPINSTAGIGDINGDGANDVVIGSNNGWVFAFNGNGSLLPGWPQFTGNNADYPANCATAACTGVIASPTLADLDGDGRLEVIVGSYSHKMFVWRYDGQTLPGWPRDVWDGIASSAAVGDLDRDGSPDVVVGSDVANDCNDCPPYGRLNRGGLVHAFRIDGTELPGWPQRTDSFMASSPALVDLDRDGSLEVVSGGGFFPGNDPGRGRHLYAWHANGSLMWRFDASSFVIGSPAIGDLSGDGVPEIAVGDNAGNMHLLRWDGSVVWSRNDITQNAPNGAGAYFFGPALGDVTGDGVPEVVATDANWHVRAWNVGGGLVMDTGTRFALWNSPAVADLDRDGTNEVVAASASNNGPQGNNVPIPDRAGQGEVTVFNTNGKGGTPWPQHQSRVREGDGFLAFGSGFRGGVRTAVGNFTNDPGQELATAAGPGGGPHVRVWSFASGRPELKAEWFAYTADFASGLFVASANVDGAGLDELVTGAGPSGGPHVRVWAVENGGARVTDEWFAYGSDFRGGVSVAGGNVRPDDGAQEVVTGAGPGGGPHVRVFDVRPTVRLSTEWFAYNSDFRGGVSVGAGDFLSSPSGDEVVTGAGPGGGPHVRVFGFDTASSGQSLRGEWFAFDSAFRGGVRVSSVPGSGLASILIGAGPGGGPHVRCFNGNGVQSGCSFFAFGSQITNGVFPSGGTLGSGLAYATGLDGGLFPAVNITR